MPRFIGNESPWGAIRIANDATENSIGPGTVRITYAQMLKLDPTDVMYSLDTSDRGSRGRKAKRWFRWFTTVAAIQTCTNATDNMRKRAA